MDIMTDWTLFDKQGRILMSVKYSEMNYNDSTYNQGRNVIEGTSDPYLDYVDIGNKTIKKRPKMSLTIDKTSILANGSDAVTIKGIPDNAIARVGTHEVTITDGTLTFTTDMPGEYTICLECFPYLEEEVTINAT